MRFFSSFIVFMNVIFRTVSSSSRSISLFSTKSHRMFTLALRSAAGDWKSSSQTVTLGIVPLLFLLLLLLLFVPLL